MILASNPEEKERNESVQAVFEKAFPMSGLSIQSIQTCDARNEQIIDSIYQFDVLVLSGGHVPTQNMFFQKINLKERIKEFDGIIMGISAGTMNSAEVVYAHPELDGESVDPNYQRFISGLGLTKRMILPHYQLIKDDLLDGKRVMEDIAYPDSKDKEFLCLVDGSYVLCVDEHETLYGEAYLIKNGKLSQICKKNQSLILK